MNVAVADSGGNLVAFQRMGGAMLASIRIAEHKASIGRDLLPRNQGLRESIQITRPVLRGGIVLVGQWTSIRPLSSDSGLT